MSYHCETGCHTHSGTGCHAHSGTGCHTHSGMGLHMHSLICYFLQPSNTTRKKPPIINTCVTQVLSSVINRGSYAYSYLLFFPTFNYTKKKTTHLKHVCSMGPIQHTVYTVLSTISSQPRKKPPIINMCIAWVLSASSIYKVPSVGCGRFRTPPLAEIGTPV